jgi:hypothetical protein
MIIVKGQSAYIYISPPHLYQLLTEMIISFSLQPLDIEYLESINIAYYAVSISISLVEIAAIGNTGR